MDTSETNMTEPLPFDSATGDIILRRVPADDEHGQWDTAGNQRTKVQTNVPWSVVWHSPDGFEWGYGGSGPADLALNILNLFVPPGTDGCQPVKCYREKCSRTAQMLHQAFKSTFISQMPNTGGVIPGTIIRAWIAEQQPSIVQQYQDMDIFE